MRGMRMIYEDEMSKKRGSHRAKPKMSIVMVIVLILLAVLICCKLTAYVTLENEYTVVKQFGEIKQINSTSGLRFKVPFIQVVESIPKAKQFYDIPVSGVFTSDKKQMIVDAIMIWRITDPEIFMSQLGGSVQKAEVRLSNLVFEKMKEVISATPQQAVISNRDILANIITDSIGDDANLYGVELVRIETKKLDLPDDNKKAIYDRMISERNSIAQQFLAEGEKEAKQIRNITDKSISIKLSDAEAQAAEIRARGESEYMRILNEAYSDAERAEFYSYMRALDGFEKSLRGGKTKFVIGKDSPLSEILYSK